MTEKTKPTTEEEERKKNMVGSQNCYYERNQKAHENHHKTHQNV